MPAYEITAQEAYESLNGFDEVAIKQAFGQPVNALADADQMAFARALAFTMKRRDGLTHADAYQTAMGLSIKALQDVFEPDPGEVMPTQPVTPAGKEPTQSVN